MISEIKQVATILLLIGSSLFVQAQPRYNFYDLGPIIGTNSSVQSINNAGNLAGYTFTNGGFSAFSYISNQFSLIAELGGADDRAVSINNSNHMALNSLTNGQYYPFLYNGLITYLGDWGGTNTCITGMDDFDDVIGYTETTNGVSGVFYNGQPLSLGDLGGGISYPWGVNNLGLVVGSSALLGGQMHACYFTTNGPVDLNATYASNNITLLSAEAVNNQTAITGWATTNNAIQPFLIDTNGLTLLPIPAGGSNAYSLAINSTETIVGSLDSPTGSHAAVWQNGVGYDLNFLVDTAVLNQGWRLNTAYSLNDVGIIVGVGNSNSMQKAFLLKPNQPPIVNITFPTTNSQVAPIGPMGSISPTVVATDDGSYPTVLLGCDKLYYQYGTRSGSNYSATLGVDVFGSAALAPGKHTITAVATDNLGASTQAQPVIFNVVMITGGLVCWLKPDALVPGTVLTNWQDSSLAGNNATANLSNAPVVVGNLVNGYAGVQFNGTNSFLNLPAILSGATGLEAFFVVRAGTGALWHCGTNYPEGTYSTNAITESAGRSMAVTMKGAPQGFNIYHVQSGPNLLNQSMLPNTSWRARVNGNVYYEDVSPSLIFTNLCLGRNLIANNTWGYGSPTVVEVIIYKSTLAGEVAARAIGSYLNLKYNLDTNLPTPLSFTMNGTSIANPNLIMASWSDTNNVCSYMFYNSNLGTTYGQFFLNQTAYQLTSPGSSLFEVIAKNYVGVCATNIYLPQVDYYPAGTTYLPVGNIYTPNLTSFSGYVNKVIWWIDGTPSYTTTNYPWAVNLTSSNIASHTLIPQAFDASGNSRFCNTYVVNFMTPVDTDGDGVPDYIDPYPYDTGLTNSIPGLTNSFTAPIITITEP